MRAIWSGSISFGLINIPVKLQSAVQTESLDLDMLNKEDLAPIRFARIDAHTGEEVNFKDIVKGYQYAKGKYVVLSDEDFEAASPEKSKNIDIVQFVKAETIDPVYFEKPYYIVPAKGAEKSYHLLLQALQKSGTAGLAEFMLRNREHVCAIRPYNDVLLLNQMRYQDELKTAPEVTLPKGEKITGKELELAVKLVEQLSEEFEPAAFKDDYMAAIKKIIKAKAAGKNIRIAEPQEDKTATVKDLMEVLKKSLQSSRRTA
jgi:DNA end-binding protein Ku